MLIRPPLKHLRSTTQLLLQFLDQKNSLEKNPNKMQSLNVQPNKIKQIAHVLCRTSTLHVLCTTIHLDLFAIDFSNITSIVHLS